MTLSNATVAATLSRIFGRMKTHVYSLRPDRDKDISTQTLTVFSEALERGYLTEHYLSGEHRVALRLTQQGAKLLRVHRETRGLEAAQAGAG